MCSTVSSASAAGAIKKTLRASEQRREDIRQGRDDWRAWQTTCDPTRLVFLDETGTTTNMVPRYGRSRGGERCEDSAPGGHWQTSTFVAGLRMEGLTAPWCLDAAMNGEAFKTYVTTQLIPTLQPGDIVIADNLSAHKAAGVTEAIEAAGATLRYLPAYSPDFNPIEQVFAKLKTLLRKAQARTFEALWRTIGELLDHFESEECQHYFINAGYECN